MDCGRKEEDSGHQNGTNGFKLGGLTSFPFNITVTVFAFENFSFLCCPHSITFSTALLPLLANCCVLCPLTISSASSAYAVMVTPSPRSNLSRLSNITFHRSGPTTDPCRHPRVILFPASPFPALSNTSLPWE
ncbi:hypothetical protein J6590_018381 [Homalodisca vitripennis]|nr:hypothetical protein J6590_018381 [Homalodisca vitripennis]